MEQGIAGVEGLVSDVNMCSLWLVFQWLGSNARKLKVINFMHLISRKGN